MINTSKDNKGSAVMYAIAFDLDVASLKETYHNESFPNSYNDIKKILGEHGFEQKQGSLYYGNIDSNAVSCMLAVMDLTKKLNWFSASVRDIRMLRIEDSDDLMPVVQKLI